MIDTKTLKDKFKAAQEVTSLASADRMLIVDANGEPKKIERWKMLDQNVNVVKTVDAGNSGWLRIATISYDSAGIVSIVKGWGNTVPSFLILSFLFHANGVFLGKVLTFMTPGDSNILSKFRFVYKGNNVGYLDVYAPTVARETFNVRLSDCRNTTLNLGDATDAEIPQGFSSKVISAVGGG